MILNEKEVHLDLSASLEDSAFDRQHMGCRQKTFDEEVYRTVVLRSSPDQTEDELDHRLELEAQVLGIQSESPSADRLMTSASATTIASDPQKPGSTISQSTGPTSCSSSERQNAYLPPGIHPLSSSPTRSITPSLYFFTERKASAFRNGFRKMSVFKRRRSGASIALTNVENGAEDASPAERRSKQGSLDSSVYTPSRNSSWSPPIPPATNPTSRDPPSDDKEAMRRAMQCVELQELQSQQRHERDRFLEYQRKCLSDMRTEHELSKKQKIDAQAVTVKEAMTEVGVSGYTAHLSY
jgi:hypothetical protein